MEQDLYIAHAHRHTSPSSHILLLTNWEHSPYLARNLHTAYVQKLTSIPFYPTHTPTHTTRNLNLNIYLVSNKKALALLDRTHIFTVLHTTITKLTGRTSPAISLNLCKKDSQHIDSHTSYTDPYPNMHNPTQRPKKSHYEHSAQHGIQIASYTQTDRRKRGAPHKRHPSLTQKHKPTPTSKVNRN